MVEQATLGAKAPARIKGLLVKELVESWQGLQAFVVVCPIGLDAIVSNQLRAALTSKNIEMKVVKNSLARLALNELDLAPAADLLDAPSAVCYGGESVVDVAREVVDWSKKDKALKIRGAFVEGKVFSAEQVRALASMPNRVELLAQIAGLIASPGARLVSALQAVGGRLAGSVKALAEKLAEQATPAEATGAEEGPEPSDSAQPETTEKTEDAAESKAEASPESQDSVEPPTDTQKKDTSDLANEPDSAPPESGDEK